MAAPTPASQPHQASQQGPSDSSDQIVAPRPEPAAIPPPPPDRDASNVYVLSPLSQPGAVQSAVQSAAAPERPPPLDTVDRTLGTEGARLSSPTVRFKSTVEEIALAPESSPPGEAPPSLMPAIDEARPVTVNDARQDATPEFLQEVSRSLQGCPLQEKRMNNFAYEPFSLPVSRVCTPPPRTVFFCGVEEIQFRL